MEFLLAKCKQKIQKTQKIAGIDGLNIQNIQLIEVIKHEIQISQLSDNDNTLLLYDDNEVKGFWGEEKHKNIITKDIKNLKRGATWPDAKVSKVAGMTKNPKFHGYFKQNYISAYIYMTKVASNMYSKGKFLKTDSAFEKKVKKTAQIGFEKYKIGRAHV